MSEYSYVSSDLFHISLHKLSVVVHAHISHSLDNDKTDWAWYRNEFAGFLVQLEQTSADARLNVYTRDNYVKFCRMMAHIHEKHSVILPQIPQWSFLATELHCRVLEREIVEAKGGRNAQEVNHYLHGLLCRMRQGM
jgi:hypothetical protein